MTARTMAGIPKSAVDPTSPWKLPRLGFEFTGHPYKITGAEWKHLLRRAKQGDAEAQWGVAERYFDGCKDASGRIIVNRSPRKGREWLQRAAEGGLADAQNTLGVLLGNGDGFHKDARKALVWLKRAFRGGKQLRCQKRCNNLPGSWQFQTRGCLVSKECFVG